MAKFFLSDADLQRVKTHKYQTTGYSKLDNLMNPFWIKTASFLPHWLSPNMVTVIGLLCLLGGVSITVFYDWSMEKALPNWLYVVYALSIFIYQTFDAMDGKHARATGRQSPLGQLMDHGCDAFSNSFLIIMIAQAHKFGGCILTIIIQFVVQLTFFVIQWEEQHSGYLITQIDNLGVTEFQFIGMFVVMIPVFFGQDFSGTVLFSKFGYDVTIAHVLLYVNAFHGLKTAISIIAKNIKSVDDLLAKMAPVYSFLLLGACEFLCLKLKLFKEYSLLILILNGMFFGYMTSKFIVCTMAKKKPDTYSTLNIIYFCLLLVAIFANSFKVEVALMSISGLLITWQYASFMWGIIRQLMNFLQISF